MVMPDDKRDQIIAKQARNPRNPNDPRYYCGDNQVLPQGYIDFDTRNNCLKRGVGIGVNMPLERRQAAMNRPPKQLNWIEATDLAGRLKINTFGQTKKEVLKRIANVIKNL